MIYIPRFRIHLTLFICSITVINGVDASTKAAEIYAKTCSVCHGEDGAGAIWGKTSFNPPPVNFVLKDKNRDLPRERMIHSVTHGRPGTAMTAFATRLNKKEIEAVVDYIRNAFMIESTAITASNNTQQAQVTDTVLFEQAISATLIGNAQTGQVYYLQNCTACHGTSGKGDGPRAYFIHPRPRNFLHPASKARFNRPVLFKAIKQGIKGREMPAWGKVLNDQQIADITEYVFHAFIRADAKK